MTRSFDLAPLLAAAATTLCREITGDVRWVHLGPDDLAGLTFADRELIHVVTGERLPLHPTRELLVSFFTLQLATDRLVGPLTDGEDVSIGYVEDVYTDYDARCPDGNPMSGDLLDLALAFLAGRELAVLGPEGI